MAKAKSQRISDIPLDKIKEPKAMVRMDIDPDYIKELAQSISEIGLLQPILVAIDGDDFETVHGHCRYLAHKRLGVSTIRAMIRKMSPAEIGLARATENIARLDLTPIEEAATYKNLIEEYGMTLEKVSQKMGKTPGTIKRRMDLLRMPPILQKAVHSKKVSMTVAEELWPISDLASLDYYLMFAIENGCSKEVARGWAKDWKDSKRRSGGASDKGPFEQLSICEPRPTYLPCDVCLAPVDINEMKVMRVCPGCGSAIKKGMEVVK
ncbi:Nucleoid occlusion protein [subsurface metagenome]